MQQVQQAVKATMQDSQGHAVEHRGLKRTGRTKKLPSNVAEDLLAEVQRLHVVNSYLNNLQVLVLKEERRQQKSAGNSKAETRILAVASARNRSKSSLYFLLSPKIDEDTGQIQGRQSIPLKHRRI